MCGIVGIIGIDVVSTVINGLKRLEYRGCDSAGIAFIGQDDKLHIHKALGSTENLEAKVNEIHCVSNLAIGHTRWATHGRVTVDNAHPHFTDKVAIVHNGIVENHVSLRKQLIDTGYIFKAQTDSEVIAVLLTSYLDKGLSHHEAFRQTIDRLKGSYALVAILDQDSDTMFVAKRSAPVVLGLSDNDECLAVASDGLALSDIVSKLVYLEDDDHAILARGKPPMIYDNTGQVVQHPYFSAYDIAPAVVKGDYHSFMLKEIYEQPAVLNRILDLYIEPIKRQEIIFPEMNIDLTQVDCVNIIACGTSYNAGLISSHYLEEYAGVDVNIYIASEFCERKFNFELQCKNAVFIFISQSGETSDTISAMKLVKDHGGRIISILNVQHAPMHTLSEGVIYCNAGTEISVASTKSFTAQLFVMMLFTLFLARKRQYLAESDYLKIMREIFTASKLLSVPLVDVHVKKISQIAKEIAHSHDMIYIGRGVGYGVALEGALKMKEVTYLHAEGIAAGELKHGSMALIDESMTVVVSALTQNTDRLLSNIEEVITRGGRVIIIGEFAIKARLWHHLLSDAPHRFIEIPKVHAMIAPLLHSVILQLLVHEVALILGRNPDKPRNLAKAVTVE